jgi:hypothetical protein
MRIGRARIQPVASACLVVTLAEWEPDDGHALELAPAVPVEGLPDRRVEVTAWIGNRNDPAARGTVSADAVEVSAPLRLVRVP